MAASLLRWVVTVDTTRMKDWKLLDARGQRRTISRSMAFYMQIQRRRLRRGVDVHGRAFDAYDPAYRVNKDLAGRMVKNFWLRLSGDMLRSQKSRTRQRGRVIESKAEFTGDHARYRFNKKTKGAGFTVTLSRVTGSKTPNALIAAANNRKRSFVGLSKPDFLKLIDRFHKELHKEVVKFWNTPEI